MFFMFLAGIDSSISFAEAIITNFVDQYKWNRTGSAAFVCVVGILISLIFCSSFGWVLFDLIDHYISSYIVIGIGLMQVVSVGWLFEKETTAIQSKGHADSIKWMGAIYWPTVVIFAYFANFGFTSNKWIGVLLIVLSTAVSFGVSFKVSGMPLRSWYHEIVLCGVDKVSMSITALSNPGGTRSWWMIPFEAYFGITIKFVTPVILIWLIFENLYQDLMSPYAEQPADMQMYSSIVVLFTIMLIFGPMFACDYPEVFEHNVNLEFDADNQFAKKLRKRYVGMNQVKKLGDALAK